MKTPSASSLQSRLRSGLRLSLATTFLSSSLLLAAAVAVVILAPAAQSSPAPGRPSTHTLSTPELIRRLLAQRLMAAAAPPARDAYRGPVRRSSSSSRPAQFEDEDAAMEYEDFAEMPPFLRMAGGGPLGAGPEGAHMGMPETELLQPKGKRYLGIDIPDYITGGGKSDKIKNMSLKMKAMGRR